MSNDTKKEATTKIAFSEAEKACFDAAIKQIEKSTSEIFWKMDGGPGTFNDPQVYAKNLLVEIVHNKYDACVATATPTQSAEKKEALGR